MNIRVARLSGRFAVPSSDVATRATPFALGAAAAAVAAYLRFYKLGEGGLGNAFYAAAVRSMRHSLHNFAFVAFDQLGAFSVDKPPLALWLQTMSTFVFGFGGFALMLPQAVAGVLAVVLLIWIVRQLHGGTEGVVAGLCLAVLPASVLVSRNNTMDTLVMLMSLTTLGLAVRSGASGRLRPLVAAAVVAGLAFNTKGFEAFVALPGIAAYLVLALQTPLWQRAKTLLLLGLIAAVVGMSWATAASLVPSSERPLVLNSDHNSAIDLMFGYNGIDRILGDEGLQPGSALTASTANTIAVGTFYGGARGPLRVFGEFPGPLIAAAIPLTLAGAAVLAFELLDRRTMAQAALWLLWLFSGLVAFSASRLGSAHYFESFSPALAMGMAAAFRAAWSERPWLRLVTPAGASGSAFYALARLTDLRGVAGSIEVLAFAALVGSGLAVLAALARVKWPAALAAAPAACIIAILFAMSFQAIRDAPVEGVQPGAVFLTEDRSRQVPFDPASPAYSYITGRYDYLRSAVRYLEARRQPGQYLAGVRTFYMAAPFIAERDLPLLPLYSEFRNRPELPVGELRSLMDERKVEYFLVSQAAMRALYPDAAALIEARCREDVSRPAGLAPQTGLQLLHCR